MEQRFRKILPEEDCCFLSSRHILTASKAMIELTCVGLFFGLGPLEVEGPLSRTQEPRLGSKQAAESF